MIPLLMALLFFSSVRSFSSSNAEFMRRQLSTDDRAIERNLPTIISRLGPQDLPQFAQNYMLARANRLRNGGPSEQEAIRRNLHQMYNRIHGLRGSEASQSSSDECTQEPANQTIVDILAHLERTERGSRCGELSPGQHRTFPRNDFGIGGHVLKRRQDGNYQAVIGIDFQQTAGASISNENMFRRVQQCLRRSSPAMRGPDGRTIELIAASPADVQRLPWGERPLMNNISIESPSFRSNALAYQSDIDCATVVHEVLHLMGLCDEYEEQSQELSQRYACRVVVRTPSIMRRQEEVFPRAVRTAMACRCTNTPSCRGIMNSSDSNLRQRFLSAEAPQILPIDFRRDRCQVLSYSGPLTEPSKNLVLLPHSNPNYIVIDSRSMGYVNQAPFHVLGRNKITCFCPPDDRVCADTIGRIRADIQNPPPRNECPDNTETDTTLTDELNASGAYPANGTMNNGSLVLISRPTIPSLLHPSHYHRIVEGNCPGGRSANYSQCAEWAYRGTNCNPPRQCQDDSFYLGISQ